MLFRQVIHEDLGCASYLVGDVGEGIAAVVDPQWDIEPYLHLSRLHGVRIEHVLETHNHADHVSGHGRLARATGATIHISRLADAEYAHEPFDDGWMLAPRRGRDRGGRTPRATGPSTPSFVLRDRDAGRRAGRRADRRLAVRRRRRPPRPRGRAGRGRARPLPLAARAAVHAAARASRSGPGTWAARMCGGSGLDHRTSSTIGFELAPQPRDRVRDGEEFVADGRRVARRPTAERRAHRRPQPRPAASRSSGTPTPLSPRAVEVAIAEGALVVDARTNDQFDEAHIPGAISASAYDTGFATKVAKVVAARRRADRRRGLRRLRARGGRPARLGRPAGARLPRRAG